MTLPRTVVFDLDGTLVDTAPDLIAALNFVLDREGVPPVPLKSARNMIGAGARKLIERGLELEGRMMSVEDVNRLMKNFIDYYAAHIADASRPFEGLEAALDRARGAGLPLRGVHQQAGMAVEAAARPIGPERTIFRHLRRRHVRRLQARPHHPAADGGAGGRRYGGDHHGGRRRPRRRRGAGGPAFP